jgi:lysophospholipase L1-like esterase
MRTGIVTKSTAGIALAVTVMSGITSVEAQSEKFNPPKQYYLALGDSIAYGFQRSKYDAGLPASAFDTGYVDRFAARLRLIRPGSTVVNYACPGESTRSLIAAPCGSLPLEQFHDAYTGTQLDAAVAFLRAHPGDVSPITLRLWGNDVRLFVADCKGDLTCVQNGAFTFLRDFSDRLAYILGALREAAPDAEIIVTGGWDTFLDVLEFADPLFHLLNASIAQKATAQRVRFADPFPTFNPQGDLAREIQTICTPTLLCTEGDSHPSDAGYRVLGDLLFNVSDYWRLLVINPTSVPVPGE